MSRWYRRWNGNASLEFNACRMWANDEPLENTYMRRKSVSALLTEFRLHVERPEWR